MDRRFNLNKCRHRVATQSSTMPVGDSRSGSSVPQTHIRSRPSPSYPRFKMDNRCHLLRSSSTHLGQIALSHHRLGPLRSTLLHYHTIDNSRTRIPFLRVRLRRNRVLPRCNNRFVFFKIPKIYLIDLPSPSSPIGC